MVPEGIEGLSFFQKNIKKSKKGMSSQGHFQTKKEKNFKIQQKEGMSKKHNESEKKSKMRNKVFTNPKLHTNHSILVCIPLFDVKQFYTIQTEKAE